MLPWGCMQPASSLAGVKMHLPPSKHAPHRVVVALSMPERFGETALPLANWVLCLLPTNGEQIEVRGV